MYAHACDIIDSYPEWMHGIAVCLSAYKANVDDIPSYRAGGTAFGSVQDALTDATFKLSCRRGTTGKDVGLCGNRPWKQNHATFACP